MDRNKSFSEITNEKKQSPLTNRETEVLSLVASGDTSKKIAGKLGLTVSGVDFHLRNVMEKLKARNRPHAVAISVSLGYITIS